MDFKFPKIVRPIQLKEYAPEFGEEVVDVWVNPPRGELAVNFEQAKRHQELIVKMLSIAEKKNKKNPELQAIKDEEEATRKEIYGWFAKIWSQGPDEKNHWTAEEVETLHKSETDPVFYRWLTVTTQTMINDWRMELKKVSPPPS